MNLEQRSLSRILAATLMATLILPVLIPSWRLSYFSPFLVVLCYQRSYLGCLWGAALCGLFLDLLSAHPRLGLYAMNYSITMSLIYTQRRNFFTDSPITLPLMTFLFSAISGGIQGCLVQLFEGEGTLSWSWIASDLLVMPALDALYAAVVFGLAAFLPSTNELTRERQVR